MENAIAKEVQVDPLFEGIRADDHAWERRRAELPRRDAVGTRTTDDADDWHGVVELRPTLLASELAPVSAGAIEAAIHDEAEVVYPLITVVSNLASARVVRL